MVILEPFDEKEEHFKAFEVFTVPCGLKYLSIPDNYVSAYFNHYCNDTEYFKKIGNAIIYKNGTTLKALQIDNLETPVQDSDYEGIPDYSPIYTEEMVSGFSEE